MVSTNILFKPYFIVWLLFMSPKRWPLRIVKGKENTVISG